MSRRTRITLFLTAVIVGLGLMTLNGRRSNPNDSSITLAGRATPSPVIRDAFARGLDSLAIALDQLDSSIAATGRPRAVVPAFRRSRALYKRIETLLEAFAPAAVEALNGPAPEPEGDHPYLPYGAPAGFQVIEDAVFGGESPGADSLRATVRHMRGSVIALTKVLPRVQISSSDLLDALRIELARVSTLGVAGFDAPGSSDAIVESAAALEGGSALVRVASSAGEANVPWATVDSSLLKAANYLRAHAAFDSLDRLAFIVSYVRPAAQAVVRARSALPAPPPLRRLWRQAAATPFDSGAFDPFAYAPVDAPTPTTVLVALGKRLFSEPKLSGPGTRSCAFCHVPDRAFTDGLERTALLAPTTGPHRNTPTLINAAFSPALFDDLRALSFEMQVGMVLANPAEMAGSDVLAARRLNEDSLYRREFTRAFPSIRTVTPAAVRQALGAYVRSLTALESRFDHALRGDTTALSDEERLGFTVFTGKGRCASCHFLPLFNGTLPPNFVASDPEIIGTPSDLRASRLDDDPGLGAIDAQTIHHGAFKVPTLRNVELTAPYMHNGAFRTLEEVVDFYDRGGGAGSGLDVLNQTLSPDPLHLSVREKAALVKFMKTLTDSSLTGALRTHPGER